MDEVIRVAIVISGLTLMGVVAYGLVTMISVIKRRQEKLHPGVDPNELEALHARVAELEERVDFSERILAAQQDAERLSAINPPDRR